MPNHTASRLIIGVGLVVVAATSVLAVRWAIDETLTRHTEVDPDSWLAVTIRAERHNAAEHEEEELVEALATMCQLEVNGRVADDSLRPLGHSRYTFVVRPSLDEADQQQLEGCMEDFRIDHFLADVELMEHHGS